MGHGARRSSVSHPEHVTASSIPVVVVGGYLGAGKTTFINACLTAGLRDAAIIVNDFGSINIDAHLISAQHGDTLELTNGCVCCSVGNSLADTLFTILDRPHRPTQILIEASGVADPASVAAFSYVRGLHLAGILVLADAQNAEETAQHGLVGKTFDRQIQSAHVIAMTKTDIVDNETENRVKALLHSLNSQAPIVSANPNVLASVITNVAVAPHPTPGETATKPFTTSVVQLPSGLTRNTLNDALDELPSGVVRAKGIVQLADGSRVLVQKVGTHLSLSPTDLGATDLVVIAL